MQKDRSWKKADYPNRMPSWKKHPIKDPFKNWNKVSGWIETDQQAKGIVRALKVQGNRTKVIKKNNHFDIYYQKMI